MKALYKIVTAIVILTALLAITTPAFAKSTEPGTNTTERIDTVTPVELPEPDDDPTKPHRAEKPETTTQEIHIPMYSCTYTADGAVTCIFIGYGDPNAPEL